MRIARTDLVTNALLLGALLAAPFAWTAQLVVGYGIAEVDCSRAGLGRYVDAWSWELAVGLAAAAVALGGLLLAAWLVREVREHPTADDRGRLQFMAAGGVLVSALFLFLIVLSAVSALSVGVCEPA